MIVTNAMMVPAQAILIDDANEPVVHALEGRSARLAVLSDDGSVHVELEDAVRLLRQATYVALDHAADLIGTAAVALNRLVRRGDLIAITRAGQTYVSLQSVLDYRDEKIARIEAGLDEIFRATREAGLYDIELGLHK
jgi:hypothetical protein